MPYNARIRRWLPFCKTALSILVIAAAGIIFIHSSGKIGEIATDEQQKNLERVIRQSAVHCYAVNGYYPESLDYLIENYAISIDESRYFVSYRVFSSNIMPEIDVVLRQSK